MNARSPVPPRGFSLLELLAALLITSVLLTIALPAWHAQGFRVERTAAQADLQRAAQCQARRSAWMPASAEVPDLACLPRDSRSYRFLVVETDPVAPSDTAAMAGGGFEWRAEPRGRQRGDRCGTLVLDHRGRRSVLGTMEQALRCWQGR